MLLILSRSQPLHWAAIWFRRFAAFLLYFEKISILTVLYKQKDMTTGHVFLFGFRPPETAFALWNFKCLCPCTKGFTCGENACAAHQRQPAFSRLRSSLTAALEIQTIGVHRSLLKRRSSTWMTSFFWMCRLSSAPVWSCRPDEKPHFGRSTGSGLPRLAASALPPPPSRNWRCFHSSSDPVRQLPAPDSRSHGSRNRPGSPRRTQ